MMFEPDENTTLLRATEESRLHDEVTTHLNPMEWPFARKLSIIGLMSFATFNDSVASTIFTPNTIQIMDDFHVSNPSLISLLISIHVIGFATGPLLIAPLSEVYGRVPLTHASNVVFVFASILCATSVNLPMLLFSRVLIGLAGCVPVTLVPGYIADLIPVENRGKWMTFWSTGYLVGTVTGPVFGGYMGLWQGWRSAFWLEAIITALTALVAFVVLRETFVPVLLSKDPKGKIRAFYQVQQNPLRDGIVRSAKIVAHSPVLLLVTLHTCVAFVSLYFLITTIPKLFHDQYGFNEGQIGTAYIGQGIGFALGEATFGPLSDWYQGQQDRAPGIGRRPEGRLTFLIPGNLIIAVGLLGYGWSVQANLHWILPVIGTGVTAFGMVGVLLTAQLYVMDGFGIYAASANSVNIVVRSALGTLLPLTAPVLYEWLEYGWGNTVLASVALALVPVSFYLCRHGHKLRRPVPELGLKQ